MSPEQLPLTFPLRQKATYEGFFKGNNAELLDRLLGLFDEAGFGILWLWGTIGVGRSHLLQASCHLASDRNLKAAYLPAAEWQNELADTVAFGDFDLVCIDDLNLWLEANTQQAPLMALYQELFRNQAKFVVAADKPPGQFHYQFADLASRFQAAHTYEVVGLNDEDKTAFLKQQALARGLTLDDGVLQFLFSRVARDLPGLIALLDRLDHRAMARQRRITIPFIREELGL